MRNVSRVNETSPGDDPLMFVGVYPGNNPLFLSFSSPSPPLFAGESWILLLFFCWWWQWCEPKQWHCIFMKTECIIHGIVYVYITIVILLKRTFTISNMGQLKNTFSKTNPCLKQILRRSRKCLKQQQVGLWRCPKWTGECDTQTGWWRVTWPDLTPLSREKRLNCFKVSSCKFDAFVKPLKKSFLNPGGFFFLHPSPCSPH